MFYKKIFSLLPSFYKNIFFLLPFLALPIFLWGYMCRERRLFVQSLSLTLCAYFITAFYQRTQVIMNLSSLFATHESLSSRVVVIRCFLVYYGWLALYIKNLAFRVGVWAALLTYILADLHVNHLYLEMSKSIFFACAILGIGVMVQHKIPQFFNAIIAIVVTVTMFYFQKIQAGEFFICLYCLLLSLIASEYIPVKEGELSLKKGFLTLALMIIFASFVSVLFAFISPYVRSIYITRVCVVLFPLGMRIARILAGTSYLTGRKRDA